MDNAPSETSAGIPELMAEIKSAEIDYDVKALLHSQTYYQSVKPRDGNPTHVVRAANVTETRFRVEKGVYNFSEFILSYDANIAAVAGVKMIFGSVLPIQSIQVRGEKNNALLMDVPDMNIYGTQVPKFETARQDFEHRNASHVLYPGNVTALENARYEATAVTARTSITTDVKTAANLNFLEHKYVSVADDRNAVLALGKKSIRFGDVFPNSFLGFNKLIPITEGVEIVIRWCPSSGWGFRSTAGTDWAAGNNDLLADITLTNLTLHMSQEQPHTYVYKKCIEMVESNPEGLILSTPLITTQEGQAPLNTQTTVPFFLSNGMGKKISKIIIIPVPQDQKGSSRYDFNNTNGAKVEWYWSKFNNQTIQPEQVDCKTTDIDYQQNYKRLKDSPLGNFDVFRYNWAIYEDFSGVHNAERSDYSEDSLFVGKDATSRDTFELKLKTGATPLLLKCFFIGTQRIHIMADGIRLLP